MCIPASICKYSVHIPFILSSYQVNIKLDSFHHFQTSLFFHTFIMITTIFLCSHLPN